MNEAQLNATSAGARFYRADLHIHSYGASFDVTDPNATPEGIVTAAKEAGLSIISVADHNDVRNVRAAVAAGLSTGILVIPGIELSTPEGHLLCYTPTPESMDKFFNQLSIAEQGTDKCRCQTGMVECLNKLKTVGGFGIIAHADGPKSFEETMPRMSNAKLDILCHEQLLGFEVIKSDSVLQYNPTDTDAERQQAAEKRVELLDAASNHHLARILNSDAHTINAIGKNASRVDRVTRYKMEKPSFDGLRLALEEADTRVRIEDEIPSTVPIIKGLNFQGGFLDDQIIHFSPNLTCIIGGRGTGKSTAFEAIRLIGKHGSHSGVVDSDVWPDILSVVYKDETDTCHTIMRPKNGSLENYEDAEDGPTQFAIDSWGQGETQKISAKAESDPLALLEFLDTLVSTELALKEEGVAREELNEIYPQIKKAQANVDEIPSYERNLKTKQDQIEKLKTEHVEDLIKLQQKLEGEKRIRGAIASTLERLDAAASQDKLAEIVTDIGNIVKPDGRTALGGDEGEKIARQAQAFHGEIASATKAVEVQTKAFSVSINADLKAWNAKEAETAAQIEKKKQELSAAGISFDMSFIKMVTADEARLAQNVKNLLAWRPELERLKKQKAVLLKARWDARKRVSALRLGFAKRANDSLKTALSDLMVSVKYYTDALSPDAEDIIIRAMSYRTTQQVRAQALIRKLTLPVLLECIYRKNTRPIIELKSVDDKPFFSQAEAEVLLETLSDFDTLASLETVGVHDAPKLNVTKANGFDASGKALFVHRDFRKLSLGQQQSVLLALMLTSESKAPLIVDQPEDNLDSEFIYKTLLPVIRQAKERRQVIIVTHNPNIAVLGDAEQIVVLRATSDKSTVVSRGSIDDPATREATCNILEGARSAFARRAKIYGYRAVAATPSPALTVLNGGKQVGSRA